MHLLKLNKKGDIIMNKKIYLIIEDIFLKGGVNMAVLANSSKNISFKVKSKNAKQFIERTNSKKITKDFLEECKKAASLFSSK